jgi:hypothetical protein
VSAGRELNPLRASYKDRRSNLNRSGMLRAGY